jgi:hypothetical protein
MTRFLFGDLLWKEIRKLAKTAHRTKAAIAYVTKSSPLAFKSGDVLVLDASDGAIASGQTSAKTVSALWKKGVVIYSHNGLHAKVIVADCVLVASSANLSESSLSKLFEAGIETDNLNNVSSATGMIAKLIEKSSRIDKPFIARIMKIQVKKHFGGGKSKARTTAKGHRDPVTWLTQVYFDDDPKTPEELRRIKLGMAKAEKRMANPRSSPVWLEYARNMHRDKQVRQGDNIVQMEESANGEPQRVYCHAPVLLVENEPNCTRVYYEELPNEKKKSLSWSQFKQRAKLAGIPPSFLNRSFQQLSENRSRDLKDYWEQVRGQ